MARRYDIVLHMFDEQDMLPRVDPRVKELIRGLRGFRLRVLQMRNNSRRNIRRNRMNAQATQRDIEADVPLSQVLEDMRSRNKRAAMAEEIPYVPQPPSSQLGTQGSNQARGLDDFVANMTDIADDVEW
ncbi:hypothetical protein Salat_1934000 [Sesamum alatum]|uniref:Uncharacterized protein n=1 Tax=Sesamum alatum TaxID=300844 RepID=A0AAE2CIM0_9LAMI|nr:hypothetical protein Salat_1934000 [Sesamum alatum]